MTRSFATRRHPAVRFRISAQRACVAALILVCGVGDAQAQRDRLPLEGQPPPTVLPEPLVPLRGRDESVEDQMHASALFAEGRLLFRREEYERALERYQRAYRYSDGSSTILAEIIPLAFSLGRLDEAARYARRATSHLDIDPFVWRRLALHLTEGHEYRDALRYYEFASQQPAAGADDDGGVPAVITQFEVGRLLYLTNRFDESVAELERVSQLLQQRDPPAAEKPAVDALLAERQITFALIAEANLRAGKSQRAGEMFRLAYAEQPDAPIVDYHMARVAAAEGRSSEALTLLRKYLKSGDDSAGAGPYELLGELRDGQNDAPDVLSELKELAQHQPQNAFLLHHLGQLHLKRDEPGAAVEWFERLMAVRPLVDGYRGLLEARVKQQNERAIVELLAEAVPRLEDLETLEGALATLLADGPLVDRVFETAEREFLNPAAKVSVDAQRTVALAMAELQVQRGERAKADGWYERAAGEGENADPAVWLAWGMNRLVSSEPARAAELFARLREILPDESQRVPVDFYLAAALALDQRYDEALVAARRAAERAAQVPAIQLRPAWVLMLARRWPEAAAEYKSFIERYDDQHDSSELRAVVRDAKTSLSSVCVYMQDNEEAERWLEEVLDEFPDDVGAHNDLGYLWADRGVHLQRALQMTRFAVEREPDNRAYRDSYGWALFRLGRHAEAVEQLRQAAAGETTDGVILEHLGDALRATDDVTGARDAWRRALDALDEDEADRRAEVQAKIEQLEKDSKP